METDETEEALEQQRPINTKPCEEDQPKNMALTPIVKIHKLSYSQSKGPTTILQPENPFNWRKNIDQRKEIKSLHVLICEIDMDFSIFINLSLSSFEVKVILVS